MYCGTILDMTFSYAQSSGGYDFGYAGNVLGAGGTTYAGLENAVANKYWWMDAKGNYNSTKILERGANGKYVRGVQGLRNGYNIALKAANGYKVAGNVVGGLGLLVTGAQTRTTGHIRAYQLRIYWQGVIPDTNTWMHSVLSI